MGEYLEKVSEEQRAWWACQYVMDLYTFRGKRSEQIEKYVRDIKAAFKSLSIPYAVSLWEHTLVACLVDTCRRSPAEVRKDIVKRLLNQKYDMNFELMYLLREHTGVAKMDWRNPDKLAVDNALLFLLAGIMFDVGLRASNAAGNGPKQQGAGEEEVDLPTDESVEEVVRKWRTGGLAAGGFYPGEEKLEAAMTLAMAREGHEQQLQDWTFAVVGPEGPEKPRFLSGGPEFLTWLQTHPNQSVLYGEVRFPTGKMTSGKGKANAQAVTPAMLARRTALEEELFELLLNFWRWNKQSDPSSLVFTRRGMTGFNSSDAHHTRTRDLVEVLKMLTERAGILMSHVSAISFRKGNVSTCFILTREERVFDAAGMESVIRRGGKWVHSSRVPTNHYLLRSDDRGPFARVASWEEAILVGGGMETWRRRQGALTAPEEA